MGETVLELEDLTVRFRLKRGDLTAVNGVSFSIAAARPSGWWANRDRASR
jgi:ABC-type dipeptide/oligopeptide/nickel transport system ATPase component